MTKPASARARGRAFEKEVLAHILETFALTEDDARCAGASVPGVDIVLTAAARAKVGLSIECKNQKAFNIWGALEQAKKNTKDGTVPALVFRRTGARDLWIAVPLSHYLELRRDEHDAD